MVVRAEGYLPVEIPFLALIDHQELPTAPLVRSLPVEVRTTGPDGRPLAEGIAPVETSVRIPEGGSAPPVEIHLKGRP